MNRRVQLIFGGAFAVVAGMQLVQAPHANPPTDPHRTIQALLSDAPEVASVINRACRDCHTNETAWPWYSYVAPVSWMIADHVADGRAAINFSDWAGYPPERRRMLLKDACDDARNGEMPLRGYASLHPQARLTPVDIDALCRGARRRSIR